MRIDDKLEALAQDYEARAAAIRLTAASLAALDKTKAVQALNGKLQKAITVSSGNGHGHAPSPLKGRKYHGTHWTQRPENKARLARVSRKGHATRAAEAADGVASAPARRYYGKAAQKRRLETAQFLSRFNASEPTRAQDKRIGALVRRQYLAKHHDGGYVRTSKVFIP